MELKKIKILLLLPILMLVLAGCTIPQSSNQSTNQQLINEQNDQLVGGSTPATYFSKTETGDYVKPRNDDWKILSNEFCINVGTPDCITSWPGGGGGTGDVESVGDCLTGACYDGTSDGGTYAKFYDPQGAGTLGILNLTAARAWNLPDLDGTVALTANKLSAFAATTSSELAGNISDETGSGGLCFATDPVFSTSVQIPNGAAPTVDAAGEIAIDTTDDQLVFYGGAKRVVGYEYTGCFPVQNLTASFDAIPIFSHDEAITITAGWAHCKGTCTTNATFDFEDSDGNDMTMDDFTSSDWGTEPTPQAVSGNGSLIAYEGLAFNTTNTPDPTTDIYLICFNFILDSQ